MKYGTAPAFRRALEDRLKMRADGDGARLARERKRVVFHRFLARLVEVAAAEWMLKGGFALDLRLGDRARSTKDIDLAWRADEAQLLDALIDAALHDVGDFFTFTIERTDDRPERFGEAHRFGVAASLAGRPFEAFVLDVGFTADVADTEILTTPDLLDFAGIGPVEVPTTKVAVQVAEKLHAYTRIFEGGRVSTRTKDLVDLALIARLFTLDADELRLAIEAVFGGRASHQSPRVLPPPPDTWRKPFGQLARTVGIDDDLGAGHDTAAAMLDPILDHRVRTGTWESATQQWASTAMPAHARQTRPTGED